MLFRLVSFRFQYPRGGLGTYSLMQALHRACSVIPRSFATCQTGLRHTLS
jgi:hypothetical protein